MGGVARVGDILGKGGLLTFPFSPDVTVNGRPVALEGCFYTPHPPCGPKDPRHCFGPTFSIPNGVTINGLPPITKGSLGLCGDPVKTASSDVIVVGGALDAVVGLAAGAALGGLGGEIGGLYSGVDVSAFSGITETVGTAFSGIGGQIAIGALGGGVEGALGAALGAGVGAGVAAAGLTGVGAQIATAAITGGIRGGVQGALSGAVGAGVTAGVNAGLDVAAGELKKVVK